MGNGTRSSSRFIDVPADAMLGLMRSIAEAVRKDGGDGSEFVIGREVVIDIYPPKNHPAGVRVFTSLARGESSVRECGEDAVRIVQICKRKIQDKDTWYPVANTRHLGRRIYRTAPKGDHDSRVKAFLARLKDALREAYRTALHVSLCPQCGFAMDLRSSRTGSRFLGCVRYPDCRGTRNVEPAPQNLVTEKVKKSALQAS